MSKIWTGVRLILSSARRPNARLAVTVLGRAGRARVSTAPDTRASVTVSSLVIRDLLSVWCSRWPGCR